MCALALFALAISACASQQIVPKALPCLSRGGAAWVTFSTERFDFYTDFPPQRLTPLARDLEQTFVAFSKMPDLALAPEPPPGRITVVAFSNEEDFRGVVLRDAAGVFDIVENELEPLAVIYLNGDHLGPRARELVIHELSHRFLAHHAPAAPSWLNEGLAEYLSSFVVENGRAVLGHKPRKYEHRIDELGDWREVLKESQGEDRFLFYARAWALVHLITESAEGRAALRASLRALGEGATPRAAFERLAGLDWKRISREFPRFLEKTTMRGWVTLYQPAPVEIGAPRRVDEEELHLLWMAIRPWRQEVASLVAADLEHATMAVPESIEVRYWKSRLHAFQGSLRSARWFAAGLAREWPEEERFLANHLQIVLDRWLSDGKEREGLEAATAALAPHATLEGSRWILARAQAEVVGVEKGLSTVDEALRETPGSARLHHARGWILAQQRRFLEAIDEIGTALGLLSDGADHPGWRQELARLEELAFARK